MQKSNSNSELKHPILLHKPKKNIAFYLFILVHRIELTSHEYMYIMS